MFEIGRLMAGNQFHHARPEPGRGIQCFGMFLLHGAVPGQARGAVHLPRMRFTHDGRQKPRGVDSFAMRQLLDLQLEILRQQLADPPAGISPPPFPAIHRTSPYCRAYRHGPIAPSWGCGVLPGGQGVGWAAACRLLHCSRVHQLMPG